MGLNWPSSGQVELAKKWPKAKADGRVIDSEAHDGVGGTPTLVKVRVMSQEGDMWYECLIWMLPASLRNQRVTSLAIWSND